MEKLSKMHFIKLDLKDASGKLLSTNFYWRSKTEWQYEELMHMPPGRVKGTAGEVKNGMVSVDLENLAEGVALMVRLKVVDQTTGLLAAPVLYSDNYFSLAPNESRHIEIDLRSVHAHNPFKLMVEGWNVEPAQLAELRG